MKYYVTEELLRLIHRNFLRFQDCVHMSVSVAELHALKMKTFYPHSYFATVSLIKTNTVVCQNKLIKINFLSIQLANEPYALLNSLMTSCVVVVLPPIRVKPECFCTQPHVPCRNFYHIFVGSFF